MKPTEIDEIKMLMDRGKKITTEQKNIVKGRFWEPHTDYTTDKWRGTPKARMSFFKTPITVEPEMLM